MIESRPLLRRQALRRGLRHPHGDHGSARHRAGLPGADQRPDHEGAAPAGLAGGADGRRRHRDLRRLRPVDPELSRDHAAGAAGRRRAAPTAGRARAADRTHATPRPRCATSTSRWYRWAPRCSPGRVRSSRRSSSCAARTGSPACWRSSPGCWRSTRAVLVLRFSVVLIRVIKDTGISLLTRIFGFCSRPSPCSWSPIRSRRSSGIRAGTSDAPDRPARRRWSAVCWPPYSPAPRLAAGPSLAGVEAALVKSPVYLDPAAGGPQIDAQRLRAAIPKGTYFAPCRPRRRGRDGHEGGPADPAALPALLLSSQIGKGGTFIVLVGGKLYGSSTTVPGSLGDELGSAQSALAGRWRRDAARSSR